LIALLRWNTRVHNTITTAVAQHVGMDREGEAGTRPDALNQLINGVGRERAAALGRKDKARSRGIAAVLAKSSLPCFSGRY
jgi:hypothetical protein